MFTGNDFASAIDPTIFAGAVGFEPDAWQSQALRWDGRRLLLNCHRQSGKSTTAALLAVHRAIYWPGSLILLISPSLRQSSELFRKVGDWFGRLEARPAMPEDNRLSCVIGNGSRVVSLPGSESTVRGFSAVDLLLVDEAARVPDPLYFATRPMLAVSGGGLIGMSTPFGKRGWFHEAWANGGSAEWERIEVPATQCPRLSAEFLASERAALGDWFFRQEYNCEFMQNVDSVFDYNSVVGARSKDVQPLFGGAKVEALADAGAAINRGVKPPLRIGGRNALLRWG